MTISLCMIVKNEENNIERCLKCVDKIADEIIIIDTGSTDNTKQIAKKYTDKVFDYEWTDDFSAARNYSFSKATMDYILWLDADDVILDDDIKKIIELKGTLNPDMDVVLMKYAVGVDEYNHITHSFYRERILKKSRNYKWIGAVHEYVKIEGNILQTDICITHATSKKQTTRNLKILETIIESGRDISSRELYYYAKELHINGRYDEAVKYYLKYLDLDNSTNMYVTDVCIDVATYYMSKKEPGKALKILIKSMEYGIMKPEILCYIGSLYKEEKDYIKAISWYELIFKILIPKFDLEMHLYELGGFIPCIDLCYCYYELGDFKEACKYNEMAAKYKPNDPIIEYNRKKFREVGII